MKHYLLWMFLLSGWLTIWSAPLFASETPQNKVTIISTEFVLNHKFKLLEKVAQQQNTAFSWVQVDAKDNSGGTQSVQAALQNSGLVIVDTPPVLAVTDPSIVGAFAGTTLMVARYGQNTIKEIDVARNRFEQSGIEVKGVIFNAIEKKASSSYGYGYYNYTYSSDKK